MIEVNPNGTIQFLSRNRKAAVRRKLDRSYDLISGTTCPECSNVILAKFITDKPVKLRDYEQTSVMHTRTLNDNGTFSHWSPADEEGPDATNYAISVEKFEDKYIQTIRLKNHIILPEKANNPGTERMEVGERTCMKCAVAALDDHIATELALAITGSTVPLITNLDYSNPRETLLSPTGSYGTLGQAGFRFIESYGSHPMSVILVPKRNVENNFYMYVSSDKNRKS